MKYKILLFFLAFIICMPACTDDFEEINTNPTSPADVPAEFLFTNAQWAAKQQGYWVFNVLHLGMWVQHYGNQNSGFTMAHYEDRGQDASSIWNNTYLLLADLDQAGKQVAKQDVGEVALVKNAMIEVMAVETWYYFTQLLGDIPYSEALGGVDNVTPAYDAQEDIIRDLFDRLDAAISDLGSSSVPAMGDADKFYASNTSQWVKYANALKLKMALGIIQGDAALAQSKATEAMGASLLTSNADNAILPTNNGGPAFRHPMWDLDRLADSDRPLAAEAFVNQLVSTDDPRIGFLLSPTQASIDAGGDLEYRGVPPAPDNALYGMVNASLNTYSTSNGDWVGGAATNFDKGFNRMTFAEVSFMKAEAALRGWGGNASNAQTFFEEGIQAAMTIEPFVTGGVPQADIDTYVAANGTLPGDTEAAIEQVITQKWILFFADQDYDSYIDWRRTGYPTLDPGLNPGETGGVIPRRLKYSQDEPILNQANYDAAVSRLGGNTFTARIWSDQ